MVSFPNNSYNFAENFKACSKIDYCRRVELASRADREVFLMRLYGPFKEPNKPIMVCGLGNKEFKRHRKKYKI
jgi:hypothetical protein